MCNHVRHMETNVSQTDEHVADGRSDFGWSPWTRLVVAAPGAAAAAVLICSGLYLVVAGFDSPLRADDEFASISGAVTFLGIASCVFGLLVALAVLAVTLRRARRVPLVLSALFTSGSAACATYLLATGADRIVYVPLIAILAYLAAVATLRLSLADRTANA